MSPFPCRGPQNDRSQLANCTSPQGPSGLVFSPEKPKPWRQHPLCLFLENTTVPRRETTSSPQFYLHHPNWLHSTRFWVGAQGLPWFLGTQTRSAVLETRLQEHSTVTCSSSCRQGSLLVHLRLVPDRRHEDGQSGVASDAWPQGSLQIPPLPLRTPPKELVQPRWKAAACAGDTATSQGTAASRESAPHLRHHGTREAAVFRVSTAQELSRVCGKYAVCCTVASRKAR